MNVQARHALVLLFVLSSGACGKSESSTSAVASGVTTAAAAPASASAAPQASAPVDAGPKDASFTGTYAATASAMSSTPSSPAWNGDVADAGLGDGTLSFTIDGATGRLLGKGDGALGDVVVNGQLGEGGKLTFALLRANPTDGGFTGTGWGTRTGDTIQGTVHASTATGNVLREATFTVSRK
jgi:hypothetical protein